MKSLINEIPVLKYFLIANALNCILLIFSFGNNSGTNAYAYKAEIIFSKLSNDQGKIVQASDLKFIPE